MTHDYKHALKLIHTYEQSAICALQPNKETTQAIRKAIELAIALQPKPISKLEEYSKGKDRLHIIMSAGQTHFYDISALPKPEVTE